MNWVRWSEEEEEILRQNYATASNEELCVLFPGRKLDSIRYHARQLGLSRERKVYSSYIGEEKPGKKGWTKEEDELLRQRYESSKSIDELLDLLPGRTPMAIYAHAFQLRLKRRSVQDIENRRVRTKEYVEAGLTQAEIARLEGVSLSAIQTDIAMLGLQKRNLPKPPEIPKLISDSDKKIEEIKDKLRQTIARRVIVEDKPIILKSWEKKIICDFGRSLSLAELKMLLPKRSKADIIEAARFFGIEISD